MPKKLCLKLINASTEEDVTRIIENHPSLKQQSNWRPYGGVSNNTGTVTGQSNKPEPSLIEKITNSIDAILIKACKDNGMDPESPDAPQTMEQALKQFFDIDDRKYCDLSNQERRQLACNVQVIAEGSKTNPNIIIYDNGEGQHPQDFPSTLVSLGGLGGQNKVKIFFVQGKYNMGGTAVLPFCGNRKYQLIVSKKNLSNDNSEPCGFTIVRRNDSEGYKIPWFEYCVNDNGKIFEFKSSPLNIGLYNTKFDGGTFIKLFAYDLRNRSDIQLGLWRDLNRYLYKPALPVLMYEKRDYGGKTSTKLMHGNRMRAIIDEKNSLENRFSMTITVNKIEFPIEVFILKKEIVKQEFVKDMAVIFTLNGQVQHSLDNSFISQKAKKSYLKGSLLVNVDCSNMPRNYQVDIFMSSRSQMRENDFYRALLENISKELKDNEYLKKLDEKRMKDEMFDNPKDEEFLKKIMGKLLVDDKEIKRLLGLKGGVISSEVKKILKSNNGNGNGFQGQRFPSIFKFKNLKPGNIKMLPQNGECKIEIKTDVENEYLIRPHDQGELKIRINQSHARIGSKHIKPIKNDEDFLDINRVGPNEGNIKLRVKPNRTLPVGTQIPIDIEMSAPQGPLALSTQVKIDNPKEETKQKEINTKQDYALPMLIEVYNNQVQMPEGKTKTWEDLGWNELDVCKVQESSKEETLIDSVYINMDARELVNYIRAKKITGKNFERINRTYKTAVYLITLVLFYELHQRLKVERSDEEQISYDPAEQVSFLMKGLAKILLHITTNEHLLKEIYNA